ncbi:hypothetical protein [Paenarthrobacter sp. PH39-S1]|uniref:hypothetical protein n=1 Tax=Paenarthrobacter sp. PH39-S1 TaxID=3046204 RepID=UPI0024B95237|nr:hypothetical protein [Paenarthrobacter sp. PH39-S1]MDJ0355466.1 hypothetical protein [Paenarthrobacter sp. PH39-S1]
MRSTLHHLSDSSAAPQQKSLPQKPPARTAIRCRTLLVPAAALLLGLTLSSCSGAPATPDAAAAAAEGKPAAAAETTPAAPTVGTPFTVTMRNGNTAKITIVSATRTESVGDPAFSVAGKNGGFLVLDILWETEKGKTSSNPFYVSAKDAEGRKADQSLFVANPLGAGDVLPGDKARGSVAFDIAPGTATVMISDPLMQEAARVQIDQ